MSRGTTSRQQPAKIKKESKAKIQKPNNYIQIIDDTLKLQHLNEKTSQKNIQTKTLRLDQINFLDTKVMPENIPSYSLESTLQQNQVMKYYHIQTQPSQQLMFNNSPNLSLEQQDFRFQNEQQNHNPNEFIFNQEPQMGFSYFNSTQKNKVISTQLRNSLAKKAVYQKKVNDQEQQDEQQPQSLPRKEIQETQDGIFSNSQVIKPQIFSKKKLYTNPISFKNTSTGLLEELKSIRLGTAKIGDRRIKKQYQNDFRVSTTNLENPRVNGESPNLFINLAQTQNKATLKVQISQIKPQRKQKQQIQNKIIQNKSKMNSFKQKINEDNDNYIKRNTNASFNHSSLLGTLKGGIPIMANISGFENGSDFLNQSLNQFEYAIDNQNDQINPNYLIISAGKDLIGFKKNCNRDTNTSSVIMQRQYRGGSSKFPITKEISSNNEVFKINKKVDSISLQATNQFQGLKKLIPQITENQKMNSKSSLKQKNFHNGNTFLLADEKQKKIVSENSNSGSKINLNIGQTDGYNSLLQTQQIQQIRQGNNNKSKNSKRDVVQPQVPNRKKVLNLKNVVQKVDQINIKKNTKFNQKKIQKGEDEIKDDENEYQGSNKNFNIVQNLRKSNNFMPEDVLCEEEEIKQINMLLQTNNNSFEQTWMNNFFKGSMNTDETIEKEQKNTNQESKEKNPSSNTEGSIQLKNLISRFNKAKGIKVKQLQNPKTNKDQTPKETIVNDDPYSCLSNKNASQEVKNEQAFTTKKSRPQMTELVLDTTFEEKVNIVKPTSLIYDKGKKYNNKINLDVEDQDQNDQLKSIHNQILIDTNSACNPTQIEDNYDNCKGQSSNRVHNYQFGRQIGEGAYAVVRAAVSREDNIKYAAKIYDKSKLTDLNRQRSVRREVVLLQKMNHPNIVKLIEAFETDSHVYLIMENVTGGSLHSYLKEMINKQLDEEEARRIFKQLLIALKYCHGKCIAHRDIKLENVLLDQDKNVKIIDFGFSTCIPNHKKIRMFCGTPSYMAPQIISKIEYTGPPADIWAAGILLFALLNGCFPFRGQTDEELYRRIKRGTFQVHNQKVTREYLDIIQRCLDTNDDTRPSALDLLEDQWFKIDNIKQKAYEDEKKQFKERILAKMPIVKKNNNTICILAQNKQIKTNEDESSKGQCSEVRNLIKQMEERKGSTSIRSNTNSNPIQGSDSRQNDDSDSHQQIQGQGLQGLQVIRLQSEAREVSLRPRRPIQAANFAQLVSESYQVSQQLRAQATEEAKNQYGTGNLQFSQTKLINFNFMHQESSQQSKNHEDEVAIPIQKKEKNHQPTFDPYQNICWASKGTTKPQKIEYTSDYGYKAKGINDDYRDYFQVVNVPQSAQIGQPKCQQ